MEHYFTNNENLRSCLKEINYNFLSTSFVFFTDNGVFSKNKIDYGSELLIESFINDNKEAKKILDVGCGYGTIGIIISKLNNSECDLIDINKRSVHLSKMNIEKNKVNCKSFTSNCYENVVDTYDIIISNPPIRAGKIVVMEILKNAKKYLNNNGELWFVIRKNQGAKSIAQNLKQTYEIENIKKSKGYYVYKAKIR